MELLRGHPQWQINTLNVRYVVPFRNSPNQQAFSIQNKVTQRLGYQLLGLLSSDRKYMHLESYQFQSLKVLAKSFSQEAATEMQNNHRLSESI
jgi:hypothetical protein